MPAHKLAAVALERQTQLLCQVLQGGPRTCQYHGTNGARSIVICQQSCLSACRSSSIRIICFKPDRSVLGQQHRVLIDGQEITLLPQAFLYTSSQRHVQLLYASSIDVPKAACRQHQAR